MKRYDCAQRSEEWESLRLGRPTASEFSRIVKGGTAYRCQACGTEYPAKRKKCDLKVGDAPACGGQVSAYEILKQSAQAEGYMHKLLAEWYYGGPLEDAESQFQSTWMERGQASRAHLYWLGEPLPLSTRPGDENPPLTRVSGHWLIYERAGLAVSKLGFWFLRWDLSPLGYLQTAAHGHLDALDLSIWFKGLALAVDPGTGCYYADKELRSWLASRTAHNGPCPEGNEFPKRLGPFLWAEHHEPPTLYVPTRSPEDSRARLTGKMELPTGILRRTLARVAEGDGWEVADEFEPKAGVPREFSVRWQFAPGTFVKMLGQRRFEVKRSDVAILVEVGADWSEVKLVEERNQSLLTSAATEEERFADTVSPAFRKIEWAPFLKLVARPGDKPCVFRTTFLASARS